jgi:hypothetical protein
MTKSARARFSASGSLAGEDGGELVFGRHARSRQDTLSLDGRGGRDDDHHVNLVLRASLEQQRDIVEDQRRIPVRLRKGLPCGVDRRVDDGFQPGESGGIGEHQRPQLRTLDPVGAGGPGKGRLDRRQQGAARALQPVHLGIGIEHRNAGPGEHLGNGALAHADGAGEAEDERMAGLVSSRQQVPQFASPSSRGGATPKNFSNATAAWPISIASPSIVRNPAPRAACSSGVSSGWVTMS